MSRLDQLIDAAGVGPAAGLEAAKHAAAMGPPAKGWGTLPCPCCGEQQASITLDLTDCESFHCADCDADFSAADVRVFLQRWTQVLWWLDSAAAVREGGRP